MIIKLNQVQLEYLNQTLLKKKESSHLKFISENPDKFFYFEIDNDNADEIRDLAGEELQKKGFDINYKLTEEGKILEQIIDIFYIDKH